LATNLFGDESLVDKHRHYLDKLQWSKKLGKGAHFVPAHKTEMHTGVRDEDGEPEKTPHHLFVDDDVYAEVFDVKRIEMTIACGIEAIFILLGESDLEKRQDPVSWDKLLEMVIHFINKVLGLIINTRAMTIGVPPEYIQKVLRLMDDHWIKPKRKAFMVKEAETLAGQLAHIANSAPWLKHLMSHLYTSLAASLKGNKSFLVAKSKHFREQIKLAKMKTVDDVSELERSFAQAETSRQLHNCKKQYWIMPTLWKELDIIKKALESEKVLKVSPIAHLIPNTPDADADGDSSLDAAAGWSESMQFWWYYPWPEKVKNRTLRKIKDGRSGELIDINTLEYATELINYAASTHFWYTEDNRSKKSIPYPKVLIRADNKSAESWGVKGCKRSMVGRSLGRLQCALMINNPVGLDTDYINTKKNVIADKLSRFETETDATFGFASIKQEFPQLRNCRRFHPSKELISWILDALLLAKLEDPLAASEGLLSNPGKITS
jgi:hypothetical protein